MSNSVEAATVRIPDHELIRTVTVLCAVSWPTGEDALRNYLSESLGWSEWATRTFKTGLPITPDHAAMAVYPSGDVASVNVSVTDYSKDTSDECGTEQHDTFEHFAQLLAGQFQGDATPYPYPRDHNAAYWDLPHGARLDLRVELMAGWLVLSSPEKARVVDDLIRRGKYAQ